LEKCLCVELEIKENLLVHRLDQKSGVGGQEFHLDEAIFSTKKFQSVGCADALSNIRRALRINFSPPDIFSH
jgi:hypothetical protein